MIDRKKGISMAHRLSRILALATLLFAAERASAANFACAGPIQYLGVGGNSMVNVNLGYGVLAICSMSGSWGGVEPDACRAWYSTLLTNRSLSKQITLFFSTDNSSNASLQVGVCSQSNFGTWVARPPYFLEVN
jgi:hypothetical protein